MKIHGNLSKVFFIVLFICYVGGSYAQSCKKEFWSAKEQYKSGRFESAQNLLDNCIDRLNPNSEADQVYKVYKLYIASCIENRDRACANTKRQKLITLFPNEKEADVLKRLNQTRF